MDSVTNHPTGSKLAAYIAPFVVFMGFLALASVVGHLGTGFWFEQPMYWIYPVQTIACAAVLWWYWRRYEMHRFAQVFFTLAIGVLVFVLWIAPQAFFGFDARTEGFNPNTFADQPGLYWGTVLLRFLRLVIIVPLVEEIFWRGFLLRYFVNEKFETVPFGTFTWLSFAIVTGGFMLVHNMADWPAAAVTGALYNFVAYRTKSLTSCVVAHAVTNLLLGLWIMRTEQWGFW
ncbi:CAAX prenyl protease-related protein [soil metagenome]